MFDIVKHKTLIKDFHKIVDNRLVLFNDGDNDIIFTGTNKYSNRLLCCIMFEDDDLGFLRYLHTLTSELQYSDFMNQKISFRDIIDINETVILVDVDYQMKEVDHNIVSIQEIPEDFLPLKNSFCPKFIFEPSFNYSVSMEGGLADLHMSKAEDLANVGTNFADFLKSATAFFDDINLNSNIYIEAYETGSFKINFKVEIADPTQVNLYEISKEKINNFLNNYFKYFFNDFPNEELNIFQGDTIESLRFKKLETELETIYSDGFVLPVGGVEQKLIDLINYSVESLKGIEYEESFKTLKFLNVTKYGEEVPFGIIDNNFISMVEEMVFDVNKFVAEPIISIDDIPKIYKVQIYNFSTITGKGSGFFINDDSSITKVIIHANGKDNYENTVFTKSLHEGKPYEVKGLGTWKDGKLKKLTSQF